MIKTKKFFLHGLVLFQGYLQDALVQEALQKLERRLASCNEEFLKMLETLDSLVSLFWMEKFLSGCSATLRSTAGHVKLTVSICAVEKLIALN